MLPLEITPASGKLQPVNLHLHHYLETVNDPDRSRGSGLQESALPSDVNSSSPRWAPHGFSDQWAKSQELCCLPHHRAASLGLKETPPLLYQLLQKDTCLSLFLHSVSIRALQIAPFGSTIFLDSSGGKEKGAMN